MTHEPRRTGENRQMVEAAANLQGLHRRYLEMPCDDLRNEYFEMAFNDSNPWMETIPLNVHAGCRPAWRAFWRCLSKNPDDREDFLQDYRERLQFLLLDFLKEPEQEATPEIDGILDGDPRAYLGYLIRLSGKAFDHLREKRIRMDRGERRLRQLSDELLARGNEGEDKQSVGSMNSKIPGREAPGNRLAEGKALEFGHF